MRIAILGTRGIPANYGGFETFAEELATRLVDRGHDVTVYGRSNNIRYKQPTYKGVKLVILPTIGTKYLDTVVHTFLSVIHAAPAGFDCLLICNAANAVFALAPRWMGVPVALNVDGIERKRKKWGIAGRAYYRLSEYLATKIPDVIVTDAAVIHNYYQEKYGKWSAMIAYGADCTPVQSTEALDRLGIRPRQYLLYVSRLEPENNADLVIRAFENVKTDMPLLIVGDAPYARNYIEKLKATADPRVRFPGAIYGQGYRELQSNAFAYIHATEVGGAHPALIEAMGAGNCILVYDTPENREVAGECALFFRDADSLSDRIQSIIDEPATVRTLRKQASNRAQLVYSWEAVTDAYVRLFQGLVNPPPSLP